MSGPTAAEVRELRASLGLSQSAIVARLPHGITLRAWQAWEQGERQCPPYAWAYIRAQLGVLKLPMRARKAAQAVALLCAGLIVGTLPTPAQADPLRVVQVCTVGLASGEFRCFDTFIASPDYIDCTDDPHAPPIGQPERGGGVIRWGSWFGGEFEEDGRALYEWSGWQVIYGTTVRAILGVDEDRIFGDGMDRGCRAGRFVP